MEDLEQMTFSVKFWKKIPKLSKSSLVGLAELHFMWQSNTLGGSLFKIINITNFFGFSAKSSKKFQRLPAKQPSAFQNECLEQTVFIC